MKGGALLSKLGPKTSRFDVGTGGEPELTPQDVAAALAFVEAGLGRELVTRKYWPDAARVNAPTLDKLLLDRQMAEYSRRAERVVDAEIAYNVALANHPHAGSELEKARSAAAIDRLNSLVYATKEGRWPSICDQYRLVRISVLDELTTGNTCRSCKGSRARRYQGKTEICRTCSGTGHRRVSDRERAKSIGLTHDSDYRRKWRHVYEWTLELCTNELSLAMEAFARATK